MPLFRLDECEGRADAGGKARTLARLAAAGLEVAPGFVVPPGDAVDESELAAALAALPAPYAVRSSADLEDQPGLSAAGLFESVIGVPDREGVMRAIARVRASGTAEPVRAYLAAHGRAGAPRVAVLIQPVVHAETFGVARTRDDGEFLVEERAPGEPEWGEVRSVETDPALANGLRAIEQLLGGPADVEYARTASAIVFLQARPRSGGGEHAADAAFVLDGDWRLDAEHNPEPLSAAQAGLVAFVEELGVGARQRTLSGWLYVERGATRGAAPIPLAHLAARFREEVRPDCEATLAPVEQSAELEPALAAYAHVFRRYVGEVAPALSRARAQLEQVLRANLGESLAAHGALLGGLGGLTVERDQALWELGRASGAGATLAAYLSRFGAYAPAWDVAVPPDDEEPERVLASASALATGPQPVELAHSAQARADEALHQVLERMDRMGRRAFKAVLELARGALPIAEEDDLLFFRAQRAVRRALAGRGRELAFAGRLGSPDDVFDVPLAAVRACEGELAALAAAGRAARERAMRLVPPVAIDRGRPRWLPPPAGAVLRGHGTSGRARGRAWVVRALADAPSSLPEGAVLVAPALLPSLAHLVPRARALVTDHGGATSHGATIAREYGVPAVLGCGSATTLPDGADLYVDASLGRVYVVSP